MISYKFIVYQLTRPLSYLSIKHDGKKLYDWVIPSILTLLTLVFCFYLIDLKDIISRDGLISSITDFVSILPGFFIAALAAIATFDRNDIDELIASPTPQIKVLFHSELLMVEMTRRRFLCVLFSYLTCISIILIIGTRFLLFVELPCASHIIISWLGVVAFMFILWQMIIATLLGLFYLGERLHTPQ